MGERVVLTFGGFLLLGGRLATCLGPSAAILIRDHVFNASPRSPAARDRRRASHRPARAVVRGSRAVRLTRLRFSLTWCLHETAERAKEMGILGFVLAGGGSIGVPVPVLLGGVRTNSRRLALIFLVNIPSGVLVRCALAQAHRPSAAGSDAGVSGRQANVAARGHGKRQRSILDRLRVPPLTSRDSDIARETCCCR